MSRIIQDLRQALRATRRSPLAALLAMVGVFGVMTYNVRRQRREPRAEPVKFQQQRSRFVTLFGVCSL